MSFLSKMLGAQKTVSSQKNSSGKMSVLATLQSMNAKFESHRCTTCGVTFMSSSMSMNIFSFDINNFVLNIGGYCPICRKYCCPSHSKYIPVQTPIPSKDSAESKEMGPWGIGCSQCGARLVQNESMAPPAEVPPLSQKEFLQVLSELDPAKIQSLQKSHPNVARYLETLRQEKKLDFKAVEKERLSLIETLGSSLDMCDLENLVKRSQDLQAGKETNGSYYKFLLQLCRDKRINIDKLKLLKTYVEYLSAAEGIDKKKMQQELADLMGTG